MERNKRLRYIDIAKCIAMICIILGHMGNWDINKVVFTFHVPIFYIITGFFISTKRPMKEFVKDKFRILIIPYGITCIIIISLATLIGWVNGDAVTPLKTWTFASLYGAGDSYATPFIIPAIGPGWFLWASFWGSCFLRIALNFNEYLRIVYLIIIFLFGYYTKNLFWFPLSIQAGACATLFMYIGYLLKDIKGTLKKMPREVMNFGIVFAVTTWIFFIKDFQSFWLVNCNIGRGIVDVFGSVCACIVVILISKKIDSRTKYLGAFLAYFGRYSLLILCVHVVELNILPWWQLTYKLVLNGMSESYQFIIIIIAKVILDLSCAYALSRISIIKWLLLGGK